jgi:hypothetical protein
VVVSQHRAVFLEGLSVGGILAGDTHDVGVTALPRQLGDAPVAVRISHFSLDKTLKMWYNISVVRRSYTNSILHYLLPVQNHLLSEYIRSFRRTAPSSSWGCSFFYALVSRDLRAIFEGVGAKGVI